MITFKNTLCSLITIFAISSTIVAQTITVTSPSAGDDFLLEDSITITWSTDYNPDKIRIHLLNEDGTINQNIADTIDNTGSHQFPIPQGLESGKYKIEVYEMIDSYPICIIGEDPPCYTIGDVSDQSGLITLWEHQVIVELNGPFDAGGGISPNEELQIEWVTTDSPVTIELNTFGVFSPPVMLIEQDYPSNTSFPSDPIYNSYNWTVPDTLEEGVTYFFRVTNDSGVSGLSPSFKVGVGSPANFTELINFEEYNSWGQVTRATNANGATIVHYYGTNADPFDQSPDNGIRLTGVQRIIGEDDCSVGCGTRPTESGVTDLFVEAKYDDKGRITEIIDENESSSYFTYDGFHRLKEIKNHSGLPLTEYDYTFWDDQPGSGSEYDPDLPNYIQTLMYTGAQTRTLTEYFDGLGRSIQSQQFAYIIGDTTAVSGELYNVSHTEYDASGRKFRAWKPFRSIHDGDYQSNFESKAKNYYNNECDGCPGWEYPFTEQIYDSSALNRPVKLFPEGGEAVSGIQVTEYSIEEWNGNNWLVTTHSDEEGNTTQTWADGWGRTVRTIADTVGVAAETRFEYDVLGNLRKVTAPNGLETTYDYDVRGNLTERTSPDAGTMKYKYDAAGNLRYSQDANQLAEEIVAFTQYDILARPVKSGLGAAAFSGLDPDLIATFETSDSNLLSVNVYDTAPADSLYPWSLFQAQLGSVTLNNLKGKPAATAYKSAGVWQVSLYSYDQEGRVDEKHIFTEGLPEMDALYTYSYNRLGEVVSTTVQADGESFTHDYEYDHTGAMAKVNTAANASPSGPPDLTYSYNAAGQVASRQFNGNTIGHTYTIRGWLESIGDVSGTALPFAANYEYLKNGNIDFAEFRNDQFTENGQDPYYRYNYTYDGMNRLSEAAAFDDQMNLLGYREQLTYDPAGNIDHLVRTVQFNGQTDDLGYQYQPGTNRLARVGQLGQVQQGGYEDEHKPIDVQLTDTGSLELIISQVHYNSEHQANYSAAEFIELKNISGSTINLKDWQIEDADNANQLYRVLDDFYLPPGARAVFANDQADLYSGHYRYGYDFNLRDNSGQGQTPQGQTILVLRLADNADNALVLRRPNGTVEDFMSWAGTTYGGHTWNLTQGGDKTLALHRVQLDCATGCSKPADWATAPRAPYARNFYYDANGNLIIDKHKGIAANNNRGLHFWYDERNLPVQIGDNEYRYTADGQRYYKKVGTVEEYYIMDDNLTAGVFSNTGTGYELDYWNILGHGVEGRYTLTGVPIIDTTGTISSETEPNDTQATANGPVGLQPVTGEQTGHFDQDWYYFDVLQPGAINIHLEKQGWPMVLAVYDSQLNQLDYDDGGNGSRTLWNVAVSPGRYYIEISPREQHSSNIAYTLQLEELNPTYYYFKDHLGSTRVVVNSLGDIIEARDYYPFGMFMEGRSMASDAAKEGFTGHERDDEVGLDYMVARRYDPALGRFLGVDPITHTLNPRELFDLHNGKHLGYSPYAYVFNNPLKYTDPTGLTPEDPEEIARFRQAEISTGLQHMLNLMNEHGVEIAAFMVQGSEGDVELVVFDFSGNTEDSSENPSVGRTASGKTLFEGAEVIAQIHTHPNDNPTPSGDDQEVSRQLRAPVFTLTNDNMGVTIGGAGGIGDRPSLGRSFKESVVNRGQSNRLVRYTRDLKGIIERQRGN